MKKNWIDQANEGSCERAANEHFAHLRMQERACMTDLESKICEYLKWTPRQGFYLSKDTLAKRHSANGRALFERGGTAAQVAELAAAVGATPSDTKAAVDALNGMHYDYAKLLNAKS